LRPRTRPGAGDSDRIDRRGASVPQCRRKLVDQPIYERPPTGTIAARPRRPAPIRAASAARSVSPRPRGAAERRAAIVRATLRCRARDGYARLTMKRVAAEAGVSPGILHYYFRDKRAILARAAATVMGDLDRRVATEARGARDARGHLRALLRACLEVATE